MVRSATFLLILLSAIYSNAFHLNREDSFGVQRQRPNNIGVLKYQGSVELDRQDGEVLFAGLNSPTDCDDLQSSKRQLIDRRYSASDWLYNLKTWRHSTVLKEIRNPVIALSSWATFLSLAQKAMIMSGKGHWALKMSVPDAPHKLLVSSIGLLLVFRTNSAYQRFLEGRKIWEEILSISRNLSRFLSLYRDEVGNDRKKRILHLLAAFPYLLRHHVRNGCLCSEAAIENQHKLRLEETNRSEGHCFVDRRKFPWSLLEKAERSRKGSILPKIAQARNRPLWVCDRISHEIMQIPLSDHFSSRERLKLLGNVDKLANAIGSCERIHQTAVPLHYARHALRSLTVWLVTLPFSLLKDFGLLTGPVTAMVAWLLFGVYQIGHSIEDPFQGSLRLKTLCENIRVDILSTDDDSAFTRNTDDRIPEFDVHAVLKPMALSAESIISSEPMRPLYEYRI